MKRYIRSTTESKAQIHYIIPSQFGGFTTDTVASLTKSELYDFVRKNFARNAISEYDYTEDAQNAHYLVIITASYLGHTEFRAAYYVDDKSDALEIASDWINSDNKTSAHVFDETHYYGTVIDLDNMKEIAWGDAWQPTYNGHIQAPWHEFKEN